jgi:hypothetical protein
MSGLNERSKRQIALLAGDDLEGESHAEARRSVESCPDCRRHWVRVRGCLDVLERVGKSTAAAPETSLWPAVERRLPPLSAPRRLEKFNGWLPALSMAAACIALLVAGQMEGTPPQDTAVFVDPSPVRIQSVRWPVPRDEVPSYNLDRPLDQGRLAISPSDQFLRMPRDWSAERGGR